jgi:hypothetical protein
MSPHSIATWQQAICLLVTGKVDVLEEYEAEVSSPSATIRIPAVARRGVHDPVSDDELVELNSRSRISRGFLMDRPEDGRR